MLWVINRIFMPGVRNTVRKPICLGTISRGALEGTVGPLKAMIRILYLYSAGEFGGLPRSLALLLGNLDRSRFDIRTVLINGANSELEGLPDLDLPQSRIIESGYFSLGDIRKISAEISEFNPQIISSHGYKADIYLYLSSPFTKRRRISTAHGWGVRTFRLNLYYLLQKWVMRRFDKVIVLNQEQLREFPNAELVPNGVQIRGIAPEVRSATRRELGVGSDEFLIGFVGRLSPEKRVEWLVESMSSLPNAVKLVVVGAGANLINKSKENLTPSGRVIFTGFRSDLENIYPALDLFCSLSKEEGMPNSVLEAMSYGLPCVLSDIPIHRELAQNGNSGILVSELNELPRAIEDLRQNKPQRTALGLRGQEHVREKYALETRIRRLEEIYLELV